MSKLSKMNALANKLADKPFKYGSNDCYTFTAAMVREWHGRDFSKHHKVYKNKREAEDYMEQFLGGIETLTTGTLGYSCDPRKCRDGDVVTAEVSKGQVALGFVFQGHGLFLMKKGLAKLELSKCRRGWRL